MDQEKNQEKLHTEDRTARGEVRVSVRGLVEFLLRFGDIDNRHSTSSEAAMLEGGRIHRMIQSRMGADYHAEVPLRYTYEAGDYVLLVEGRADGIIENADIVVIDEIKGTYRDLAKLRTPNPLHLAQVKCYAYMYSLQEGLSQVRVRLTYCNMETEELRYFYEEYDFAILEQWFLALIADYRRWAEDSFRWRKLRQASIEGLEFPFPYREGQHELVTNVYRTIYHKRKLFLEAPTGAGKTISTIYPALQAMGKGMGERIFYLTAKTITRTVAEETFALLRERGLHFKSVVLTAKEKICFKEETARGECDCNPENCPYAKGHFDRINEALYELVTSKESFTREAIEDIARGHRVCPFELGLDASLFADGIIGDYNYLFDPHVYLKRFFAEGAHGEYLFLIDEAHNLLERGREMYSAPLILEELSALRREIRSAILAEQEHARARKRRGEATQVEGQLSLEALGLGGGSVTGNKSDAGEDETGLAMKTGRLEGDAETIYRGGRGRKKSGVSVLVREGYGERMRQLLGICEKELAQLREDCEECTQVTDIDALVWPLSRLHAVMSDYLQEQEEMRPPVREQILECYFTIAHFLEIYELVDENYIKYTQRQEDGRFLLKLYCVNPAKNLAQCMRRGRSSILFSATLLPIQYYKKLLGGEPEDYEVYAHSDFDPAKRGIFLAEDVTSRYSRRSEEEYEKIACYIHQIVGERAGNYIVFFPSYAFLKRVYACYEENYLVEGEECLLQRETMTEEERETFLNRFRGNEDCDLEAMIDMEIEVEDAGVERTLLGFAVLGGIFGEGIDLRRDSLIGVIIVGTGLPGVCAERELLKSYFDERQESGFDYAYCYPGMNKVLQAAGRVIRTKEDVGIIALLDDRFLRQTYRRMFPREWENCETVHVSTVARRVERFWDAWLWNDAKNT